MLSNLLWNLDGGFDTYMDNENGAVDETNFIDVLQRQAQTEDK